MNICKILSTYRQAESWRDGQIDIWKDKQVDRQKWRDRQIDVKIDRKEEE